MPVCDFYTYFEVLLYIILYCRDISWKCYTYRYYSYNSTSGGVTGLLPSRTQKTKTKKQKKKSRMAAPGIQQGSAVMANASVLAEQVASKPRHLTAGPSYSIIAVK